MKKLYKNQIKNFEEEYEVMLCTEAKWDDQRAIAYHHVTGMLLGDWMKLMKNYCLRKNRKFFFGLNSWGVPCIFFDCESVEEFAEAQRKESKLEREQVEQMWRENWFSPDRSKTRKDN